MGKVTKEEVEKAKAAYAKAEAEWDYAASKSAEATHAAYAAADNAAAAWDKYIKLKREYDNERRA